MAKEKRKNDIFSDGARARMNFPREKAQQTKRTLLRVFIYFGASKYTLACLMGVIFIATLLNLAKPALLGYITDTLLVTNKDESIDFNHLFSLLAILFSVSIFIALFQYLRNRLAANLSRTSIRNLRAELFSAIGKLPISYTDRHSHGDLMSRMTNDVENISHSISETIASALYCVLSVLGVLGIMLWYSPLLALISLAGVPLALYIAKRISTKMRQYFQKRQSALGALQGQVEESITAYRTVVAFNRQKHLMDDFSIKNKDFSKYGIKASILSSMMGPLMVFSNNLSYLLVASFGAYFVIQGSITVGVIQAFLLYVRQFTLPISNIANLYAQIQTALASAERIFEILDQVPECDDGTMSLCNDATKCEISIQNIDFSYVPQEKVFRNFSMTIQSGQKIAIVGKTGSGKTSLSNLIMRFYDVDSGRILLNGHDLRDYPLRDLRQMISIVLQDTILFSDSIAQNIRYGKLDATDEDVKNAAIVANAHDFIMQLPQGYEAKLTQSGSNLSVGQCQLISLARAVLADRPVLIMDEATASVDTRTEMYIQNAMLKLMQNKTCIIIAHRLSTIKHADCIMVLEKGNLVEMGKHEELLKKQGAYYQLYTRQFVQGESM